MNAQPAICTLLIVGLTAFFSYQGFTRSGFVDRFIFSTGRILRRREYYRLISSACLHANWIHLLFNMFSLYSFGRSVELRFGVMTLLPIYLAGIVGGNLLSLYLHRNHEYLALGASGGVCGVVFACIFLLPGGGVYVFPLPIAIPSCLYAILFVFVSFVGLRKQIGNIGHDAHLGGAIIGLLTATALHPSIVRQSPFLYAVVMLLSVGLFAYLYRWPRHLPCQSLLSRWRSLWDGHRSRARSSREIEDDRRVDQLLDKASRSGLQSLTELEKRDLEKIANRRRGDR